MYAHFYEINPTEIRRLIQEQGLKKWWVAEFSGVHKTTLRRWLSGRITKVKRDNIEKLASVLTCHPNGIARPLTAIAASSRTFLD